MRRPLASLALACALTACAGSQTVTIEEGEPAPWRTFALRAQADGAGGAYASLLSRTLEDAAAAELEARGYARAETAELVFEFELATERRIEERAPAAVTFNYVPTGDGLGSPGLATDPRLVAETTLFVSAIDPAARRVVWEAARLVRARENDATATRAAAEKAMRELFQGFPYVAGSDELVEVEATAALTYYEREAARGDAGAQYLLAEMYALGHGAPRDLDAARRWYERAAEQGHPGARAALGLFLLEGPEEQRDVAEAARWLALAADQGVASAQFALGRMRLEGRGVEPDDAAAARWLARAAEQGLAAAQADLATLYLRGRGVEADPAAAARWYRLAALQGERGAQARLGLMLEQGRGVEPDEREAAAWYTLAAARGEALAAQRLEPLLERLGPGAREAAERRAAQLGAE